MKHIVYDVLGKHIVRVIEAEKEKTVQKAV